MNKQADQVESPSHLVSAQWLLNFDLPFSYHRTELPPPHRNDDDDEEEEEEV